VSRFVSLRDTAFRHPRSYFTRCASLTTSEAIRQARYLWTPSMGPTFRPTSCPRRGARLRTGIIPCNGYESAKV